MGNRLKDEISPYLQMHAGNPVDWYPWGEEALKKAEQENKPILLSVGYTACHWCHVMAHESFEDTETAQLMNANFINIKVDREERPDLDKIYQLSAQLITRQPGGWPLTVFLMPKSHVPFFAGTYFPKKRVGDYPAFIEVLQYTSAIFKQHPEELEQQNNSFKNIIKELEDQAKLTSLQLNRSPILDGIHNLQKNYDPTNGGFGGSPKFPMTSALQLLLLSAVSGDLESKKMLLHSLKKMIEGGLYDQVGGGFFRYTVDESWQIPHFEKMLYDNALLLSLLTETYAFLGPNEHSEQRFIVDAIRGTADWLVREMQSETGGFYATLSADTEGQEGKFYVWDKADVKSVLSAEEYALISIYYGLDNAPNFKRAWHLSVKLSLEEAAKKVNLNIQEANRLIDSAKHKLYEVRNKRVHPLCDDKVIASWNGLVIKGLALAGFYLSEKRYIDAAKKTLNFILENFWTKAGLYSVYKDGVKKQAGNLDDYSFIIEGIFYVLQTDWNIKYFEFAEEIIKEVIAEFEDKEAGGFYFTSTKNEPLIYRYKQYTDEAVPSSNATITQTLLQFGYLTGDNKLITIAENSLKNCFQHLQRYPDSYCAFLAALAFYYDPTQIIIIRGIAKSIVEWKSIFAINSQPNRFAFFIENDRDLPSSFSDKELIGEVVGYLCMGFTCLAPIKNMQDFQHELKSNKFRLAR